MRQDKQLDQGRHDHDQVDCERIRKYTDIIRVEVEMIREDKDMIRGNRDSISGDINRIRKTETGSKETKT